MHVWRPGAPKNATRDPEMSLRPSEFDQVCRELNASLSGAFVQKAYAPLPRLCYLEVRLPGRSVLLCLSAEPGVARLSVADARFPAPGEPPAFQRWVRQELIGAKLVGVFHDAPWRVRLSLEHRELKRSLLGELRGTAGNLLLVDGEDRVLAVSVPAARSHPARRDLAAARGGRRTGRRAVAASSPRARSVAASVRVCRGAALRPSRAAAPRGRDPATLDGAAQGSAFSSRTHDEEGGGRSLARTGRGAAPRARGAHQPEPVPDPSRGADGEAHRVHRRGAARGRGPARSEAHAEGRGRAALPPVPALEPRL